MKFIEALIEKLSGPSPSKPERKMETSGIVLVAGATGGVGRRAANILRKKGFPVRVLVFCSCLLVLYFSFKFSNHLYCLNFPSSNLCFSYKLSQVRNEEKARQMLGPDIDLVSSQPCILNFLVGISYEIPTFSGDPLW